KSPATGHAEAAAPFSLVLISARPPRNCSPRRPCPLQPVPANSLCEINGEVRSLTPNARGLPSAATSFLQMKSLLQGPRGGQRRVEAAQESPVHLWLRTSLEPGSWRGADIKTRLLVDGDTCACQEAMAEGTQFGQPSWLRAQAGTNRGTPHDELGGEPQQQGQYPPSFGLYRLREHRTGSVPVAVNQGRQLFPIPEPVMRHPDCRRFVNPVAGQQGTQRQISILARHKSRTGSQHLIEAAEGLPHTPPHRHACAQSFNMVLVPNASGEKRLLPD